MPYKSIQTILVFIGLLLLAFFGVTFLSSLAQLAAFVDRSIPGTERIVFWVMLLLFSVLLATPLILYFRLPKALIPPHDEAPEELASYRAALIAQMKGNALLSGISIETDEEMAAALSILRQAAENVVKETASAVFVSTAVMQNGRLDGLIVLATQLRLLWRIARIYYSRPSPRQMLYLYSNVGANVLIADSIQEINFAEITAPIVVSIVPSAKGALPGLQGIGMLLVNSLANGAANAFLTLRIGLLARNYCEALRAPERSTLRHSVTLAALSLVAVIVKEQGTSIVKASWDVVSSTVSSAGEAGWEATKAAAETMCKKTSAGTESVVSGISEWWKGIRNP